LTQFEALLEQPAVKRPGRGRPRIRPRRVAGDKAYSSKKVRRYLHRRGIGAVIPHKVNERRGRFDRVAYRERNQVERLINRLKQCRRVATRYEKLAVSYLAMVTIAAVLMWL
jgi:transposase